ncbi:transglutaminase TgpA family protein [Sulfuricystis multivorans]|uniref:transglutaminase TgpA family protein n=1 Tax=Sulfuricystis multivorans TaxID=2211108 RepID=UPI000F82BE69|nr:DUF3488 and transglutaminase-like domain-containing protein [Sulfuricystis multivorans]
MATKHERTAPPLTSAQSGWLLASGIVATLPLASQVPPWLAALAAGAFLWRAWLLSRGLPLPPRWLLILVTLGSVAAVLIHTRTLFGQAAGVALLVVFMALKQLEARANRDGLAIVLLGYFLTLAQFFANQSIPVAATMLGTVLIITATLASLVDPAGRPRELVKLAGTLLMQAAPLMLILFLLFPRVEGPLWGLPRDAYSGLTGLSDSMAPGTIQNLAQSDAIAFRVKFAGAAPPKRDMYWRGPVLSRLDGRIFRAGEVRRLDESPYRARQASLAYHYTLTLEAHNRPWLFALELPETLPPDAFRTHDFQLQAKRPVRERLRYTLVSHPLVDFGAEDPAVLAAALTLPAGLNPRTVELGASWAAAGLAPAERVARGLDFLRDQRLTYTLRPPLTDEHVADTFLFETKRGFCEHFAAAFVVLMRAAGVPARVVTGYQGGERNPVDDTWVIRQADAHAWAEVWFDGRGWQRIDPTATAAPARIEEDLATALPAGDPLPFFARSGFDWLRAVRYRWWAINNAWNQWVLGFDPQRQRDLLLRLGMSTPDWRSMTAWLAGLSGVALIMLALVLLKRRPHPDKAQRAWLTVCRRLAKRGLTRRPWEGPLDYAERVARELPAAADDIRAIAQAYCALRYGPTSHEGLAALRRRVNAFRP